MVEAGKGGDEPWRVDGAFEGEGEGLKTCTSVEDSEDAIGVACDGEGSDVCAVASGKGGGGGEGHIGEDGGETENALCLGCLGERENVMFWEESDDGEVELCGECVPGHADIAITTGYLSRESILF